MKTELIPVPFRKDIVFLTTRNDEPYTSMRPIVENMGLDWKAQHRKLVANKSRWGVVNLTTPSEGGSQEALCIPVRKLPAFLSTINPKKVRPEIKEKIELYQEECDNALWDYWTKGKAVKRPSMLSEINHTHRFIQKFVSVALEMGYCKSDAQKAAILTAKQEGFILPPPPPEIVSATDALHRFLDMWERGEAESPASCRRSDLRREYEKYARSIGVIPLTKNPACREISKRFMVSKRGDTGFIVYRESAR